MSTTIWIIIAFAAYMMMMVGIGAVYMKRTNNSADYFLGGRGLGAWVAALSAQASDMSGWMLMGLPGAVYALGTGQSWIAIGLLTGTILNWIFVSGKLRRYTIRANNALTLPAYFENRFHDKKRILLTVSSVVIVIFFLVYTASALASGGKLFSLVFGLDYRLALTIGAAVTSLTNVIDVVMIRQRLQTIPVTQEIYSMLTEFYGLSGAEAVIGQLMKVKPSEILYGAYSGYAIPMFNLPPTIIMALSMSVVPCISAAFAVKNQAEVKKLTESTIRITMLFALPCAVGLSVLSQPILTAVYNNARAASMLTILSYAVIFVSLVSVTTAMLQAVGQVKFLISDGGLHTSPPASLIGWCAGFSGASVRIRCASRSRRHSRSYRASCDKTPRFTCRGSRPAASAS